MTSFLAEYDQAGTRIIDEYFSNLQNSNLVEARDLLRSKKEVEDCFRRFRHAIAADRASIETVRGSIAAMSGSVRSSMETVRGSVEEEQKRSEGLLKAFKDCFCCL